MNVYQVVLLLILAFIGGITFLKLRYDINLVYAMLGIGLAGFSTDLWYYIITTRPYKFICRKLSGKKEQPATVPAAVVAEEAVSTEISVDSTENETNNETIESETDIEITENETDTTENETNTESDQPLP